MMSPAINSRFWGTKVNWQTQLAVAVVDVKRIFVLSMAPFQFLSPKEKLEWWGREIKKLLNREETWLVAVVGLLRPTQKDLVGFILDRTALIKPIPVAKGRSNPFHLPGQFYYLGEPQRSGFSFLLSTFFHTSPGTLCKLVRTQSLLGNTWSSSDTCRAAHFQEVPGSKWLLADGWEV